MIPRFARGKNSQNHADLESTIKFYTITILLTLFKTADFIRTHREHNLTQSFDKVNA